jgi:carbon-monoxide dehydrogenase small subunit
MTLIFILNGEDVSVDSDAENRLVEILRTNFKLLGTKADCYSGYCGGCSVIFNGDVVKSCLIPAFKIRGSEIITIEGYSQTDEYRDIIQGFSDTGLETCGFCTTGKILSIEALLGKNERPRREEILNAFHGAKCRCTEPEELIQAVLAAAEHRRRRLYG